MNIKERIDTLQTRIDTLTLRERGILFLVLIALLFTLFNTLLIGPQEKQQKLLLSSIGKVRGEITQLEQQKLNIVKNHGLDPNAEERKQLTQLKQVTGRVDLQIREAVDGLIEPQEMARALEGVLKGQQQLSFVRISNLGATPLLDIEPVEGEPPPSVGIYKHTMRMELEGSFANTRDYLKALEQLPWRFHWESVELEIIDYPLSRVVITVNTLSLSEGWIGV